MPAPAGVVAAVALLVAATAPGAESPATRLWTSAPRLLAARAAHAVVVADGSTVALGGTGRNGAPVKSVERFNGRRWRVETQLPVAGGLNATAAAAIGSRIYAVGGFEGTTNVPTADVHVYDLATHTWSSAAPLPAPRGGHAAVVLDGKIHVLGGGNSSTTLADHSVYDPGANRWTRAAPLRRAKGSPAAVALDGRIYAIGGRSGSADFGDVDVYDPAADRWSRGPSIPPRGTVGATVYGRSIYIFGGESQARARTLADVLRLRPGAGKWTKLAPMPTARAYARAVTYRGAVYVVGGSAATASTHAATGAVVERLSIPPRLR